MSSSSLDPEKAHNLLTSSPATTPDNYNISSTQELPKEAETPKEEDFPDGGPRV